MSNDENLKNENVEKNEALENDLKEENSNNKVNKNGANKQIKPLYIIVPVAVLILLIGGYFIIATLTNTYETPIKNYCKLMQTLDSSIIKKMLPQEMINSSDYNDFVEEINEAKESRNEYKNFKFKITSCGIESAEKLDADDLKDLNEDFQRKYNAKRNISEAYEIDFKMAAEIEYDGEKDSGEEGENVIVGKIGNKWYLIES